MNIETIELIFNIMVYVFVFLFGITIGSFLNVCIYRLPKGESLTANNSHCMTCGTEIKRYDLIPVLSWLILRGKCRACGAKITPRYMLIEALTGILFVLCYFFYPYTSNGIYFAMLALFISGLIVLAFQDLDTQEMCVSVLIYTGLIAAATHVLTLFDSSTGDPLLTMPADLKSCLIGMVSVSGALLLIGFVITPLIYSGFISQDHKDLRRLTRAYKAADDEKTRRKLDKKITAVKKAIRENGPVFGFGMGDIVVMAAGGLMLGWKATVTAVVFAIITGAVFGIIKRAVTDDEDASNAFAFGPFLILGLVIGAYTGGSIVDSYLNYMFGGM
ncbi:MAG: prepilin peptidase [Oscillospiraceae bacterium]|nr:prepilin peptidase [Oscillospiraceae bacterium]